MKNKRVSKTILFTIRPGETVCLSYHMSKPCHPVQFFDIIGKEKQDILPKLIAVFSTFNAINFASSTSL